MDEPHSVPKSEPPRHGWQRRRHDLLLALRALTALPLPAALPEDANVQRQAAASWAYPLIGALIGLGGGLVFLAAVSLGLGIGSAALLAIASQILLTGGRHERSLARLTDGFRGWRLMPADPAQYGNRIGINGLLALLLLIALRSNGIEDLANSLLSVAEEFEATVSYGTAATIALVLAGAGSRAAMVWVWFLLPPAPNDQAGPLEGDVPLAAALQAGALALFCGLLLLSLKLLLAVALTVALVALAMHALGRKRLGGHDEALLGSTQQVAEVMILLVLSATAVAL